MANIFANYGHQQTMTPQSQPIPGRDMLPNNAGGYSFQLDKWERLNRFLIISSEGGTYYVKQGKLTEQNAIAAIACIKEDGVRAVELARDINVGNRAPKTDSQLFLLVLALRHGDQATKNAVTAAARQMLRTGTHLLHFCAMADGLGGWNRTKRRIVRQWFEDHPSDSVAYQVLKCQSRDGWSMKDALRVTHPIAPTYPHASVYDWTCGREAMAAHWPPILHAHALMRGVVTAESGMTREALMAVLEAVEANVPREALPTEALQNKCVWEALVPNMGLHAIFRSLGAMTSNGALEEGSEITRLVAARMKDTAALRRQRVHPFVPLLASLMYRQGHGDRSSRTWIPIRQVIEALDDSFELAFDAVKPTGKRMLVAIDISGSMSASCIGTPIVASTAAAAMAIAIAAPEPFATVVHFDSQVQRVVGITKRTVISSLQTASGGGTDLSAAVRWALGERGVINPYISKFLYTPMQSPPTLRADPQKFEAIIVLTDNETWAGQAHNQQLLERYRKDVSPESKFVCCSMAANHANIIDPTDGLSLGCAGLDGNLPSIITDFLNN